MTDRRVHARNDRWELARYDRSGSWFLEWIAPGGPDRTMMEHLYVVQRLWVNSNNRARVYQRHWAWLVADFGLVPILGVAGGRSFDAEIRAGSCSGAGPVTS